LTQGYILQKPQTSPDGCSDPTRAATGPARDQRRGVMRQLDCPNPETAQKSPRLKGKSAGRNCLEILNEGTMKVKTIWEPRLCEESSWQRKKKAAGEQETLLSGERTEAATACLEASERKIGLGNEGTRRTGQRWKEHGDGRKVG